MGDIKTLLANNAAWAKQMDAENNTFFTEMSKGQTPPYLWIGCSDSRVPPNQILQLPPGEIFVHRNIANQVLLEDINCMAVIEYAVTVLKVKHIIVCGHYGCGGIKAAMDNNAHGSVETWIRKLTECVDRELKSIETVTEEKKFDLLCEANVIEQVREITKIPCVIDQWKAGHDLRVHGWLFSLDTGLVIDLKTTITGA